MVPLPPRPLPFKPRHGVMLAVLVSVSLAACDMGPAYRRPDVPAPDSWRTSSASPTWPSADWWQGFGSQQLDSYIAKAQTANNDLLAAAARVREADAQATIAGAPLLPSLEATADAAHQRAVGKTGLKTGNLFSPGLDASYELDFWGKNRAAETAAQALATASRYDQATLQISVLTSVATSYFQMIEFNDRLRVAMDNLASATTTLRGLQLQQDVGTVTALDVAQQETTVSTLDAAIPPLQQQLAQATDALAILVGQSPEVLAMKTGTLSALSYPTVAPGLPSTLLARRPDVASAEANLVSANANIAVARAAFFPSIDLTANGGFTSSALSKLINPASGIFSFAAGLTQPIFEGGALEGQYAYSRARYDELVADYRKAVISAFGNTEDALSGVQQTTEQVRRQENATATARRGYDIAQAQFHAGTISILTVLNTETALFTAEDALVQARFSRLQALVNLFGALGGGWQQAQGTS